MHLCVENLQFKYYKKSLSFRFLYSTTLDRCQYYWGEGGRLPPHLVRGKTVELSVIEGNRQDRPTSAIPVGQCLLFVSPDNLQLASQRPLKQISREKPRRPARIWDQVSSVVDIHHYALIAPHAPTIPYH